MDECAIEGCTKPSYRRGLCTSHSRKERLYGDPNLPNRRPGPKSSGEPGHQKLDPAERERRFRARRLANEVRGICVAGHERTAPNGYWKTAKGYAGGKRWICRLCARNWQTKFLGRPPIPDDRPIAPRNRDKTHCAKGHEYSPENTYIKNDGARACKTCTRDRWIRKTYGLEPEDYDRLLKKQKGGCGICQGVLGENLHVDHDHTTGAVRGLLCSACNTGLGQFQDSASLLRAALRYLR